LQPRRQVKRPTAQHASLAPSVRARHEPEQAAISCVAAAVRSGEPIAYRTQNGGHYDGQQVLKPGLGAVESGTRIHLVQPGDPKEVLDGRALDGLDQPDFRHHAFVCERYRPLRLAWRPPDSKSIDVEYLCSDRCCRGVSGRTEGEAT
jgi:hypothetical protein